MLKVLYLTGAERGRIAEIMSPNLTPEQLRAIAAELRQENKILAIKLYREATGSSLAEAKEAVEALAAAFLTPEEAPSAPVYTGLTPEKRLAVLAAMRARKKIEAIKIYREATGHGLAESKNAVEAMEAEAKSGAASAPASVSESRTPMPAFDPFAEKKKSGCFGVLLLVLAAILLILW